MEQSHLSSQIGKRIKLYRKQQKMTLEDLAACINRSKATVSKYECGAIVLDVETLYEIAGALQVPLECIILTVNNDFMDAGGYAHEQLQ